MTFYPPTIHERFLSPKNAEKVSGANAIGTSASFECGSFVRISLRIAYNTKTITKAKFQTNGCGFMIAAADTIAEMITGKQLTVLHGLVVSDYQQFLANQLEEFPAARRQCAELVLTAFKDALADYRSHVLEEFTGEKALICTCFSVSEETIDAYIHANSPETVADVTDACRAGSGCGSCRMLIQEMLDTRI